jgi:hypothetical protein
MTEIVNRVKNSGLISLNIEEYIKTLTWKELDIKNQLFHEIALKEKDFRAWIDSNDWLQYKGCGVAYFCSVDVIIPNWAYMLIASKLEGIATYFGEGALNETKQRYFRNELLKLDMEEFTDARVVIKGCSDGEIPTFVYSELVRILKPHVKSLMFGEPCSTVPVYKKKKG